MLIGFEEMKPLKNGMPAKEFRENINNNFKITKTQIQDKISVKDAEYLFGVQENKLNHLNTVSRIENNRLEERIKKLEDNINNINNSIENIKENVQKNTYILNEINQRLSVIEDKGFFKKIIRKLKG